MVNIHSTAIVSPGARLAKTVSVGAYSFIGPDVIIDDNTVVGTSCVIEGNTKIGKNCRIFTGAVIGSIPQDLKFKGEKTFLEIGDNNIIREYVTINLGTKATGKTVIGNNNLIMAYSHIAHDCRIGNGVIIANVGTLAGHVTIEDKVVVGGMVAIHQFVRVGKLAIIGGCSKVIQDIPPFSICDGHPARFYGLNVVGLRRAGMKPEVRNSLKTALKLLFQSGLSTSHALEEIKKRLAPNEEIKHLIDFVKNSQRGVCR
ncbi:MAG: acyl-ACP--UDP-N-acetylglucosamine O-acyltransferase [Candidatus Omnitrophica bacterium]|nr:acyl-ACP--UDP-N-acetylglucosamine O-acyltransferase [Candidatus Omnitrophota bacterium]MCM8783586.1 acyl-ACP--UDP-N-acetylglucosamine O-acyltransferase [Candidatus Omnitrophota bacterium]